MEVAQKRTSWVVIDAHRQIHARIQRADFDTALAIARNAFPELAAELKVLLRFKITSAQRRESDETPVLTPERCAKHGLIPSSIFWANDLRRRFPHTAGGSR